MNINFSLKLCVTSFITAIALIAFIVAPSHAAYQDSLMAYWAFNDPADPGKEFTGNYPATIYSGGSYTSSGETGGALSLDGINNPAEAFLTTPVSGTVGEWVKLESSYMALGGYIYSPSLQRLYFFAIDSAPYGICAGVGSVDHLTIQSGTALEHDRWYYAVLTWDKDSNTVKLYLDGSEVYSGILDWGNASITDRFGIGGYKVDDWISQSQGFVDDVALWSRPLSAEEVSGIYIAGTQEVKQSLGDLMGGNPPLGDSGVPEPATVMGMLMVIAAGLRRMRKA